MLEIRARSILSRLNLDRPDHDLIQRELVALGSEAVPVLIPYLMEPDPKIRATVACALGRVGDLRAVPALLHEARIKPDRDYSDDWNIQALTDVVGALDNLAAREALPALLELVSFCATEANMVLTDAVFAALSRFRDPIALDYLLPLCFHRNEWIVSAALKAVSQLAASQGKAISRNAVSTLFGVIDLAVQCGNTDLAVRGVRLATRLTDSTELHRLEPLLDSSSAAVRDMTELQLGSVLRGLVQRKALDKLPRLESFLRRDANSFPSLLRDVIDAYALRADLDALQRVSAFVTHENDEIRERAIKAVASIKHAQSAGSA